MPDQGVEFILPADLAHKITGAEGIAELGDNENENEPTEGVPETAIITAKSLDDRTHDKILINIRYIMIPIYRTNPNYNSM